MRLIIQCCFIAFFLCSQYYCDINSQCQLCFNEATFYKYCMLTMDSGAGKCCLSGSSDDCLKDQFYCSNKVSTSFTYHKYAFCSYNSTLCGNSQRQLRAKNTKQTVSTSVEFQTNDVCPYILVSDTNLPFNTQIEFYVDSAINTDMYVLTGSSLDSIKSQQKVSSGGKITIDTSSIAYIVLKGTYSAAFAQFSYKNVQIISNAGWMGIIIGSSFGYFLLLMVIIILITRKFTQRRLRELQSPNIVYFLKKKVIQYMSVSRTGQQKKVEVSKYQEIPQIGLQDYFSKMNEADKVKQIQIENLDNMKVFTPFDQQTRVNSEADKLASQRTTPSQVPLTAATQAPQQFNPVEKPKVTIRPYKFDFE